MNSSAGALIKPPSSLMIAIKMEIAAAAWVSREIIVEEVERVEYRPQASATTACRLVAPFVPLTLSYVCTYRVYKVLVSQPAV